MDVNRTTLACHPEAFEAIIGLKVADFDTLVAEITPAHAAAELIRKARPDRKRKIGGGMRQRLSLANQVLATLISTRYGARWEVGFFLGVSWDTISRAAVRLKPILADSAAANALMPLSMSERQERLIRASRCVPQHGGYLRLLGYRSDIWIDDAGVLWPLNRVGVLAA